MRQATATFQKINAAHETLVDEEKREQYDLEYLDLMRRIIGCLIRRTWR
jgi:curved DNA-binding protein CbpA